MMEMKKGNVTQDIENKKNSKKGTGYNMITEDNFRLVGIEE